MRRPPESLQALTPFPTVEARVHESTELWARDLRSLFEHARDRFADVSWETDSGDRVWAHKGGCRLHMGWGRGVVPLSETCEVV